MEYLNSIPKFFAAFVILALVNPVHARVSYGNETTREIDMTKGGSIHRRAAVSDQCQSQTSNLIDSGLNFEFPTITDNLFDETCIEDSENGVWTCDSSDVESNIELASSCADAGGKSVPITFKLGSDCIMEGLVEWNTVVLENINVCGGKDCSGEEVVDVTNTVIYNLFGDNDCTYDVESGGYSQQVSFSISSTLVMALLLLTYFA